MRETLEETGLVVMASKPTAGTGGEVAAVTSDLFSDLRRHYITLFVPCKRVDDGQEPQVSCVPCFHPHTRPRLYIIIMILR